MPVLDTKVTLTFKPFRKNYSMSPEYIAIRTLTVGKTITFTPNKGEVFKKFSDRIKNYIHRYNKEMNTIFTVKNMLATTASGEEFPVVQVTSN